ncbi:hypothetical protein BHC44_10375 [Snodgrassella alvi]|nr:hypothetical protein BHC44_10375 [Snodgrassella alvi]
MIYLSGTWENFSLRVDCCKHNIAGFYYWPDNSMHLYSIVLAVYFVDLCASVAGKCTLLLI